MHTKLASFIGLFGHAAFIGLALGFLPACDSTNRESPVTVSSPPPAVIRANVTTVTVAKLPLRLEVTGQVIAAVRATLASETQGTIQEIRVREGSVVSRDEPMMILDSRDLRAHVAGAEAEVQNRRAHLERIRELFRRESASKQDLDDALRAYKVAEAEHRAAAAQLSYGVIKAPFAGVVTEKTAEVGELATPGRPLLTVEDPARLRMEAMVADSDLKALRQGATVTVTVDALPGRELSAVVAQILPAGDPRTHTVLVKMDLPPTPGLRSGMFGRLLLDKGASDTIVIPGSAVIERGQLTGVFVVGEDRIARLRWIKIGRAFRSTIEVLSGLNLGERVLSDASDGEEGATVQPVDAVADKVRP